MSRTRNRSFKEELARELRGLADVLLRAGLLRDTSPLAAAASMCTGNLSHNEWNYECLSLSFVVNDNYLASYKRTIPGNLHEIVIELSVRAKGHCLDESDGITDPFTELTVDCKMEGRDNNGISFFCVWHLDRNIGDTGEESKHFVHPCYHFQFGGNQLPQELGYGRLLLVESPRIAHPPLDAILAVDFVLSNYFPNIWQHLRQEEKYPRIVQQAQRRFWLPYAKASIRGKGWGSCAEHASWDVRNVWPQIILAH
jgi:hypothetical protein